MGCSRKSCRISARRTLLLVAGLCFAASVCAQEENGQPSFSYSYSDWESSLPFNDRNPCSFRNQFLIHKETVRINDCIACTCLNGTTHCESQCSNQVDGSKCTLNTGSNIYNFVEDEQVRVDPCTTCTCRNNGFVNCVINSCPALSPGCHATELIIVPSLCCPTCPNKMYVENVNIILDGTFRFADKKTVQFGLRVEFDRELSTIAQGENLWKLGAWISKHSDGSGRKYSYNGKVFSERQASKNFNSRSPLPWKWSDLDYTMTIESGSCNNYKYLCVEFDQSDDPRPLNGVPFTFQPVNNDRKKLMDCVPVAIDCRGDDRRLRLFN